MVDQSSNDHCRQQQEESKITNAKIEDEMINADKPYRLVYRNIILMVTIHCLAVYGATWIPHCTVSSIVFVYILSVLSTLGVQAGAHRLWAHRSYRANFGLRLFLAACQTLALQNDIYEWWYVDVACNTTPIS